MREWPWFAYVLIAVIILGLFYFLYYKPKDDELKNIRDERITVEGEVAHLRQKKQELDQIQAELERMKVTLSKLEAIMPQKEEISAILRQMQQLAYDTRLNIVKFMPKEEIAKDFYAEKPISVEITGTYHNLAIFFDRLSNFRRLFNIDDFTIKALRDQTDASTISAEWTAKTYLFRQEPTEKTEAQQKRGT
ncbi:MAG: type 4a pilus biogenesis protein PilO [Candidatus Aminicenantes bacterium]|jgi:type IV pilus assembly protein PilO|nr:type 4a pilus biogenesis protein PilO [Candidatus Aminicenantes bacterium]MDH5385207.1 type 4a pilus biogenesis protein PilO [Candidatus Aminicenantes bacterium]MDH5743305.1 type 4a pilus biogenesis protein PilO [Candidatus Aminicenantes bacterium]